MVKAIEVNAEGPGAGLYTGGSDGSVRVWDPSTGQCKSDVSVGGKVGALLLASGWLFVGLEGAIKAWNTSSGQQLELQGHRGEVYALVAWLEQGMIFSGGQDRTIKAWRFDTASNTFVLAGSMEGHAGGVTSLHLVGTQLYSGSTDNTVRVWDLNTAQCTFTAQGHAGPVMSLLLWEGWILSCSLDGSVKVWSGVGTPQLNLEYSHVPEGAAGQQQQQQQQNLFGGGGAPAAQPAPAALSMCGMLNMENPPQPILAVAYKDRTIRLFALPSFEDKGVLGGKFNTTKICAGPNGLFFSADEHGMGKVWRWKTPTGFDGQQA